MGKIADYGEYFLKNGGRKLGYDENNIPETKDIEVLWLLIFLCGIIMGKLKKNIIVNSFLKLGVESC